MSDNERTDNLPPEDEDAGVRDVLTRGSVTTSDSHDSAVLLAAQDAGRDIRGRGGNESSPAGWIRWARPAAIAAVLVFAFYFVYDASMAPPAVPDTTVRGVPALEVIPIHRSMLFELPDHFEWPAQAGATGYRVVLRDADASPVWSTGTVPENSVAVPEELRDRLAAGANYLWTVEIEGPSGEYSLGPFWFRIAE